MIEDELPYVRSVTPIGTRNIAPGTVKDGSPDHEQAAMTLGGAGDAVQSAEFGSNLSIGYNLRVECTDKVEPAWETSIYSMPHLTSKLIGKNAISADPPTGALRTQR